MMYKRIKLTISGKVQGVFYRAYTKEKALEIGVTGWVKNNTNNTVSVTIEGEKKKVEEMIIHCKKGSPQSNVTDIKIAEEPFQNEFSTFIIRETYD